LQLSKHNIDMGKLVGWSDRHQYALADASPAPRPLRRLINARRAAQEPTPGPASSADEAADLVMCAAFDAGLSDAHEVTPAILRHTYVAFLLQQGARFADIGRIVGRLPQEELAAYMRFAPAQARVSLEQVDLIPPALRAMAGPQG
jgi:polysaccharide biosynthesis transport protein